MYKRQDYESYLKRFAFGPEKTKAIAAATFEGPYWRQFDRGILTPEEIVKGFCSLAPEYTEEIKEVFAHCEETITPLPYAESWVRSLKEKGYRLYIPVSYTHLDVYKRQLEFKLAAVIRNRTEFAENVAAERFIFIDRQFDLQFLRHIIQRCV